MTTKSGKWFRAADAALIFLHIDSRIHVVDISLVQFFSQQLDGFAKALEVDDLPLPQEFNDIVYIWVIG